jgi:hypothetical protein
VWSPVIKRILYLLSTGGGGGGRWLQAREVGRPDQARRSQGSMEESLHRFLSKRKGGYTAPDSDLVPTSKKGANN